jgi:hypothetical protein
MTLNEEIQLFLADASFRVQEITSELQRKKEGTGPYYELRRERGRLISFIQVLYNDWNDIHSGFNWMNNWTDREVREEMAHLRNEMKVQHMPHISFPGHNGFSLMKVGENSPSSSTSTSNIIGEVANLNALYVVTGGDAFPGGTLKTGSRIVARDTDGIRKVYKFTGDIGQSGAQYWTYIHDLVKLNVFILNLTPSAEDFEYTNLSDLISDITPYAKVFIKHDSTTNSIVSGDYDFKGAEIFFYSNDQNQIIYIGEDTIWRNVRSLQAGGRFTLIDGLATSGGGADPKVIPYQNTIRLNYISLMGSIESTDTRLLIYNPTECDIRKIDSQVASTTVNIYSAFIELSPILGANISTVNNRYINSFIEAITGLLANLTTTDKTNLVAAINELVTTKEDAANKGAASGYAPLDSASKVPALYLPSYVDDIIEAATLGDFPVTGEASKVYIALDTNKTYRWSGSTYVEVSPSDVNSVAGHTGIISIEQILAKLLTVDGAGSKLTSDMVSSGVITDLNAAWQTDINNALKIFNYAGSALNKPATADNANWLINVHGHVANYGHQISAINTENIYFRRVLGGVFGAWMKLWHSSNDGAGSGLDADTVRGIAVSDNNVITKTAAYTLTAADKGKTIECDGTITITIPTGLPPEFNLTIVNIGTGVITIEGQVGVTLNGKGTQLAEQWGALTLYNLADTIDSVRIIGDLT